jgi:hypothetical protein
MKKFDPASLLVARTNAADEGAIIRMAQKSRDLRALPAVTAGDFNA